MRRPRDYDAELKVLTDKAGQLKERKLHQLGELVIATGADVLPVEQLVGVLLAALDATEATREGWRKRGAAFFQGRVGSPGNGASENTRRDPANLVGAASAAAPDRAP